MANSNTVKLVRNKRTWTKEEDEKSIDALTELHASGKYGADNGFKPRYFQVVQTLLDVSLPNSGLKAEPHKKSRLKTWRNNFSTFHDMVLGSNTSEFGWDPNKCIITATNDVWDEYLKTHKNVSLFKDKPFPLYHKLGIIFGKHRATCSRDVDLGDEEAVAETQETTEIDLEDVVFETQDIGVCSSRGGKGGTSKKRKRGTNEDLINVYSDSCNTINNTIIAIGTEMNTNLTKMVDEGTPDVELIRRVESEIDTLPGIMFEEAFEAAKVIGKCPLKVERFFGYDQERKVRMVQMLARNPQDRFL